MALKTMIANINKARTAYEESKKALGKNAAKAVAESLAEVIPDGIKLVWTQYTPYFNDGDACTFGVNEPYAMPVDADDDDYYENGVELGSYSIKSYDGAIEGLKKADLKRISDAWDELPHDLLESAFGDHVQVIVQSDGKYEVDEYGHD